MAWVAWHGMEWHGVAWSGMASGLNYTYKEILNALKPKVADIPPLLSPGRGGSINHG